MDLTKEIAQELMEIPGEARGMHFKNDSQYVLSKWGEEGLKKVEKELEKVDCKINYREIRPLDFYPIGLRPISLLAIKKALNLKDDDVRDLGSFGATASLIVKLYLKFFYSVSVITEKAPEIWQGYFTVGELKVIEFNEKEKYSILEVRNADLHPVFCSLCLEGYLRSIVKMVVKSEVTCEEKKCTFKGDENHEYLIKWN